VGCAQTYDPHGDDDRMAGFGGCTNCASREMRSDSNGDSSPRRHCHSILSLAAIGCHSLEIYTVILLSLLSFSAKMTVDRPGLGDSPGMDRILCNHDAGAHACGHGESRPQKNPITGQKSDCKQGEYENYCRDSPYHYNDPGSWCAAQIYPATTCVRAPASWSGWWTWVPQARICRRDAWTSRFFVREETPLTPDMLAQMAECNDSGRFWSDAQNVCTDIIYMEEDGADGDGWSNTQVSSGANNGQGVHGPWGNDCKDVTQEFQVPPGVTRCTVSWKQWCSGSRDNEQDRVYINDQVVWSRDTRSDGHAGSLSEQWQNGPNEGFDQDAWYGEESVEVDCSGSLSLHFHSDIDEDRGNEKWAFSDVKIMPS
jgi:hypothetical protein